MVPAGCRRLRVGPGGVPEQGLVPAGCRKPRAGPAGCRRLRVGLRRPAGAGPWPPAPCRDRPLASGTPPGQGRPRQAAGGQGLVPAGCRRPRVGCRRPRVGSGRVLEDKGWFRQGAGISFLHYGKLCCVVRRNGFAQTMYYSIINILTLLMHILDVRTLYDKSFAFCQERCEKFSGGKHEFVVF